TFTGQVLRGFRLAAFGTSNKLLQGELSGDIRLTCASQLPASARLPDIGRGDRVRLLDHEPVLRTPPSGTEQGHAVRVWPAVGGPARLPVRDQLLPDRDAVHPVRHRGDLPVPDRGPAAGVRDLRADRDDRV